MAIEVLRDERGTYGAVGLTGGKVVLVDESDLDLIAGRKWYRLRSPSIRENWYAASSHPTVYMHRLLLGFPPRVDHRDGDGLNNRRHNLRPCTQGQNMANAFPQRVAGKSSQFKGVTWDAAKNRWKAQIVFGGDHKNLGRFLSEIEAAEAYNEAAAAYFGDFARPNMLDGGQGAFR